MKIGTEGLDLIQAYEGCRLTAYDDGCGVQTIGWGHTKGVHAGDRETLEQAVQCLQEDLDGPNGADTAVNRYVTSPMTQNQFDAFVSFTFNCGASALASSSALRNFNAGNVHCAADSLLMWNKGTVKGVRVVLPGLAKRREAERVLFLTPDGSPRVWLGP
jgi:lysozyme